jgi:PadR family transcriptional regulator PadR
MATTLRMKEHAFGAEICRELNNLTGRNILEATVYGALDRLEKRHYIKSQWGEATAVQGGRAKKFYSITPAGLELLVESRRVIDAAWDGRGSGYPTGRRSLPALKLKAGDRRTGDPERRGISRIQP